ncbi:MAG TPA: DUF2461 domain-containing protein [Flavobacteriaceae bacterium]|nr:DUF2461 domain-containing protein [Flavobacteriaceae bacterium]
MITVATLSFLTELEKNNNRDWFSIHKKEFKQIEFEVKKAYSSLFDMLKQHDDVDSFKLFRIYRDVRFSANKNPYKTHFGGAYHRKKPALRGGYYLHIQPNDKSFIAAGFWEPNKDDLLRIRKEFEHDDSTIRQLISTPNFKNTWGSLQGDEVKTAPKGFSKDHKAIDFIKKKQFIFTKNYSDKEVVHPNFLTDVNLAFKTIRPYFDYMSEVLTTDLNGVSLLK